MARTISARQILTPKGWMANGVVRFDDAGRIESVSNEGFRSADALGTLLPGMANVHTHSFQRAMAGLAERRGPDGSDDFWGWRQVMYRFLELLTPEDIEAIAANVQMEMAEAGFASSAEFHYLHHQPDGRHYNDIAETSRSIFAASKSSGIGLTHLPVLYTYGGLDGIPLSNEQRRFGCNLALFEQLYARLGQLAHDLPADFRLGIAPHSLRAVDRAGLNTCLELCSHGPIHIHAAEQIKEVEEVETYLGAQPVRWLLDNYPIDGRWCLIHATHMDADEIADLASSQAVAGLCPTTEASLGDGIFPARDFARRGGKFGIGSDSNIRISLTEELRTLELSQRLSHRRRTILADEDTPSNGRFLYQHAAQGGSQAMGRESGRIEVGCLADLVALRDDLPFLDWTQPDQRLDAWIFGVEERAVSDVWSAGRHIVRDGQHIGRSEIRQQFERTMNRLRDRL